MSQLAITKYLNELSDLKKVSGSKRESVVREAFKDLLKTMGRAHDLVFIPEHHIETPAKADIYVDGALLYDLRLPFGYWEAKDEEDDLDAEIQKKFLKGYPQDNILFEDSATAVLFQDKQEVIRCSVGDTGRLEKLLDLFFSYQRPEIAEFRKAVAQFKTDLPAVLQRLREMIETADRDNAAFRAASVKFLKHAQETINRAISAEDVREMLIQHILTEEIFSKVFDEDDFHRQNNVAKELYALEGLFFTGALKKNTLKGLEPYYNAIRTTAHRISTHTEKQTFLKVIYEGFYKVYNKKAADRLGVVYTPQEIVRFMVESADWLCRKHFGKSLIDKGVEILDPATGTGTFICEMLEHFRGQKDKLAYKYKEELHANEVAILPYYVANLNIEATYAAITGQYAEFPNLCFVDTLDNIAGLGKFSGHQEDLFGSVSEENVARIKRQNARKISVIIGNPPYNAWQENFNFRNPNRAYKRIDERIATTYIKEGSAQNQIAVYDMYTRFFRWASDRLENDGIVAFISNSSFVDARTMDGFRKTIGREFNDIWIINLKGNARTSGERRRQEGGNVFEDKIRVGVAIYFCVKVKRASGCRVHYQAVRDYAKAEEKIKFLNGAQISERRFEDLIPKPDGAWINQTDNDFGDLIPSANDATREAKNTSQYSAIFQIVSNGVKTQRDDWVYDLDRSTLAAKIRFMIGSYERTRIDPTNPHRDVIKWDRELEKYLSNQTKKTFEVRAICLAEYRPFHSEFLYRDRHFNGMSYLNSQLWPVGGGGNQAITIMGDSSGKPYFSLAIARIPDLNFVSPASGGTQQFARYRYTPDGARHDNITGWALDQFRAHYEAGTPSPLAGEGGRKLHEGSPPGAVPPTKQAAAGKTQKARADGADRSSPTLLPQGENGARPIVKDAIFHYFYAVLHDSIYREKYAQNLKREFPRIPFYPDFWRWADWGERLMALHTDYESVEPWPLARLDTPDVKAATARQKPKAMLKADPEHGIIVLDIETQLSGVPREAWSYRLGNRSALEWILDQHKEKTPKDPTIREKFNTYRFADYKEKVVDLLMRVTRVSVDTMAIVEAMRTAAR
jgi:predicted helicase